MKRVLLMMTLRELLTGFNVICRDVHAGLAEHVDPHPRKLSTGFGSVLSQFRIQMS